MMMPVTILAGGSARRMDGAAKPLLPLGGRPILTHLLDRLRPQAGPVALNVNGPAGAYAGHGLPILPDPVEGRPGPLAGVLAAMDWAAGLGAPAVVTVAGDTPFLPADLVARLTRAAGPSGLAVAASGQGAAIRDHPVIGLWPVALRDDLALTLARGERRVRDVTLRHGAGQAVWDCDPFDPFMNVNTPADLACAEALLAAL